MEPAGSAAASSRASSAWSRVAAEGRGEAVDLGGGGHVGPERDRDQGQPRRRVRQHVGDPRREPVPAASAVASGRDAGELAQRRPRTAPYGVAARGGGASDRSWRHDPGLGEQLGDEPRLAGARARR